MNKTFFEALKEFMLEEFRDQQDLEPWGYYETIVQQQDKISPIINDYEDYEMKFSFNRTEDYDSQYYNPGQINISLYKKLEGEGGDWERYWERRVDHHYVINFLIEERYWGYCQCSPEDEGYNYGRRCCGNGCDWVAPQINISMHTDLAYGSFKGVERDMWKLAEEWSGVTEGNEAKKKEEELKYYDDQIRYWEEQRSKYIEDNK
ncbi:hypothetical protein [Paenibacillus medicaginis]|uniref:YubB ferredoxin-like domain-containing protein n=1 Tax=Paenibacillus medicaginis TaxID=1470560 RepID=A0ABV5BV19_9BACL